MGLLAPKPLMCTPFMFLHIPHLQTTLPTHLSTPIPPSISQKRKKPKDQDKRRKLPRLKNLRSYHI